MRLVDAPPDAAAVTGTFSQLRMAAQAPARSETAVTIRGATLRGRFKIFEVVITN